MRNQKSPVSIAREKMMGTLEYFLKPSLKRKQGGPFNGQEFRRKIFLELVEKMNFSLIAETGTFRGITTRFMRDQSGLPVYTAEINPRFFAYARTRLRSTGGITLYNKDSREFLRGIIKNIQNENSTVLFYLDAHWGEDLPLLDEIEIIFGSIRNAVVMVDDFKVPGDEQYGYDDYGVGKALDLEYLAPAIDKFQLAAYFPSQCAELETGYRRGCIVLAKSPEIRKILDDLETLRLYPEAADVHRTGI